MSTSMYRKGRSRYTSGTFPGAVPPESASTAVAAPAWVPFSSTETLMYSSEGYYLKDEGAQGFLKFYKGGRWAFAALLPDEGTALEDYLNSLTGARLRQVLAGAEETLVYAAIPKFKSAYGVAPRRRSWQGWGFSPRACTATAPSPGTPWTPACCGPR